MREYFIKRPWDTLCKNNRFSVLELYDGRGILHQGFIEDLFKPLLHSVDLSCDTTLAELYEFNGIELHLYCTELNKYELVDISFKTHPEWRILDAIYASCSIPLLFSPIIHGDKCYIDGGFFLNYPINQCPSENPEEVFGISLGNPPDNIIESPITLSSSLPDIIFSALMKSIHHTSLFMNNNTYPFPYQICIKHLTTFEYFMEVIYHQDERLRLVVEGERFFKEHYQLWSREPMSPEGAERVQRIS